MKRLTFDERKARMINYTDWYSMPVYTGIKAGEKIADGFGGTIVAPNKSGSFELWEKVDENNNHCGWSWVLNGRRWDIE